MNELAKCMKQRPTTAIPFHQPQNSQNRYVHLIHADDRLCVWTPSNQDLRMLLQFGFNICHGWRAYLGTAQHNYSHWTKVNLLKGKQDMANLDNIPEVLPSRFMHKLQLSPNKGYNETGLTQQVLDRLETHCRKFTCISIQRQ